MATISINRLATSPRFLLATTQLRESIEDWGIRISAVICLVDQNDLSVGLREGYVFEPGTTLLKLTKLKFLMLFCGA